MGPLSGPVADWLTAYVCVGVCIGAAGRGATFWNLWAANPVAPPLPQQLRGRRAAKQAAAAGPARKPSRRPLELPGCDLGPLLNFVGAFVKPNCRTKMKWLVEALNASSPADLHRAQVAARRAASVR